MRLLLLLLSLAGMLMVTNAFMSPQNNSPSPPVFFLMLNQRILGQLASAQATRRQAPTITRGDSSIHYPSTDQLKKSRDETPHIHMESPLTHMGSPPIHMESPQIHMESGHTHKETPHSHSHMMGSDQSGDSQNNRPSQGGQGFSPSNSGQNSRPSQGGQNFSPSSSGQNNRPSHDSQNFSPSNSGQNESPSVDNQAHNPSSFDQEPKPFDPQDSKASSFEDKKHSNSDEHNKHEETDDVVKKTDKLPSHPDRNPECLLPIEPGTCRAALPRYYLDPETGTCNCYLYGGCTEDGDGEMPGSYFTLEECQLECFPPNMKEGPVCKDIFDPHGFTSFLVQRAPIKNTKTDHLNNDDLLSSFRV